jgi:hypothetical protein
MFRINCTGVANASKSSITGNEAVAAANLTHGITGCRHLVERVLSKLLM